MTTFVLVKLALLMVIELAMDTCYLVIYAKCCLTSWSLASHDVTRAAAAAVINSTTNRGLVNRLDHHRHLHHGPVVIVQDLVLDFNLFLLIAVLVRWYLLLTRLRRVVSEMTTTTTPRAFMVSI